MFIIYFIIVFLRIHFFQIFFKICLDNIINYATMEKADVVRELMIWAILTGREEFLESIIEHQEEPLVRV